MIEERTNAEEKFDDDADTALDDIFGQTPKAECTSIPRGKLHSYNWLADIPGGCADSQLVEVQFKNTRKGYYRNTTNLPLKIGDYVAVEAQPGHDIGRVSMVGALVERQMRRCNFKTGTEIRRVFRLARPADMEKYEESCAKETDTMIRARKIAEDLGLSMKIGDVEYQGDGNKAIFYYIADERVDFRQLIKVLADAFKVRIEMRQIGARQEAGRIGGIGPCGRPLCCSSWMNNFVSVATSAARFQDISLNPQKLAGQCAKLKCCLNFEVDTYVESVKRMPPKEARLETTTGTYFHFKTDIFKREITYSTDKQIAANLVTISAARAFEVIAMNKEGQKPDTLLPDGEDTAKGKHNVHDILGEGDVTRFDKKKKKKNRGQKKDKSEAQGRPQSPKDQAQKEQPQNSPAPKEQAQRPDQKQQGAEPRRPKNQGQRSKRPKGPKPNSQPQQDKNRQDSEQ